jgi:glycosyltransferase involved in cell wall biosynthesis
MTSVVVPVHNAEPYLADLLASLEAQDMRAPWEVVLVDNHSTDKSSAVARTFEGRLPLRMMAASARANPSYARNAGVASTTSEKLLFIDADDAVAPGYVRAMTTALDTHPLVTSRVDSEALNPGWVQNAHGAPWQATGVGVFFDFLPASGINIGIRRALFESLGGFPEAFSGSEDMAFSWNAQIRGGVPLHFVQDAVYLYRYRATIGELFAQGANWGRDSVLLYRTYREAGMPGRSVRAGVIDWFHAIRGLAAAGSKSARAPFAVRLGLCAGRLRGSLQYRTRYF